MAWQAWAQGVCLSEWMHAIMPRHCCARWALGVCRLCAHELQPKSGSPAVQGRQAATGPVQLHCCVAVASAFVPQSGKLGWQFSALCAGLGLLPLLISTRRCVQQNTMTLLAWDGRFLCVGSRRGRGKCVFFWAV